MNTWIYRFLLKEVFPRIHVKKRVYLNLNHVNKIKPLLCVGDILLSKSTTLSSYGVTALGMKYSHAALVIDSRGVIAEMTCRDFNLISILDFMQEATYVSVYRLEPWDVKYAMQMADNALGFQNRPYDQLFSMKCDKLSCAELVYHADPEHRMGASLQDVAGIGRPYISPDGLAAASHTRHIVSFIV